MALVRYENTNSPGAYVDRLGPDPVLDARPNWRRVLVEGSDPVAEARAADAIARAEAELACIIEANTFRQDEAALKAKQAEEIARVSAEHRGQPSHPNVTPTAFHNAGVGDPSGVLDRLSPGPGLSPKELQDKADADAAAIHAMHGAEGGVLNRLGPKPGDFPTIVELEAKTAADSATVHASGVGVLHPDHLVGGNANPAEVLVDADADSGDEADEVEEAGDVDEGPERPAKDALKAEWVAYVVAKTDLDEDAAEKLSIPKLMKLVPEEA